ncbi:MAG: YrbL family protein [Verrucomicrobiota bacterium]
MSAAEANSQSGKPLQLKHLTPFGVGGRRLCYVHPESPQYCVKVLRTDPERTIRIRKSKSWIPNHLRREYDNNQDERHSLEHLQTRIGSSMRSHFPWCHGEVETDIGKGLVLDLIRDADGKISCSLREHITRGLALEHFRPAFSEFGDFLMTHAIDTRAILDHNLALCRISSDRWKCYLIDGFGTSALLPLGRWIPGLARKRIRKKLDSAWMRFEQLEQSGGVSDALIQQSTWGQGMLNHRDAPTPEA